MPGDDHGRTPARRPARRAAPAPRGGRRRPRCAAPVPDGTVRPAAAPGRRARREGAGDGDAARRSAWPTAPVTAARAARSTASSELDELPGGALPGDRAQTAAHVARVAAVPHPAVHVAEHAAGQRRVEELRAVVGGDRRRAAGRRRRDRGRPGSTARRSTPWSARAIAGGRRQRPTRRPCGGRRGTGRCRPARRARRGSRRPPAGAPTATTVRLIPLSALLGGAAYGWPAQCGAHLRFDTQATARRFTGDHAATSVSTRQIRSAVAAQPGSARRRSPAACRSRRRSSGSPSQRRSAAASAAGSSGGTSRPGRLAVRRPARGPPAPRRRRSRRRAARAPAPR